MGGDVRLEGGVLQALGGRVELGGLSAPGTVKLNANSDVLSLGFPQEVMLSDVSLTSRAIVTAAAGGSGSMAINAQTVELFGESKIVAGDIFIQASQNLELNRSEIDGTKVSGDGGDITLRVGNVLLMRNLSNISTTSQRYGAGGDGGKITITADFIVAVPVEDSDIIANAFNGRGGNINITTQGIYGLKFRKERTPLSDITASAQFGVDGELQLDVLTNLDPTQGLATLPTNVVDPSQQIAQSCAARGEQSNRFVATGRGGLPLSPDEPLRGRAIVTPRWVTLDGKAQRSANSWQERGNDQMDAASSSLTEIVEADGWIVDATGNVVLVARAQIPNPVSSSIAPTSCPD
jgi:large exoprotein involved in heme utilization and adhesion